MSPKIAVPGRDQRHVRAGAVRLSHASAGFGLIELMIAMVLGLLVLGAAFAVFMSNQNTFRANEGLNRMQESARVAFELMSRDIRAAGGSACSNASVVESTGAQSTAFRDTPLTGSGTELTVVSGDDTAYRVVGSTNSSVMLDPTELDAASDAFDEDDWLLLCNANKTYLVEATGVSGMTVSYDAIPYDPMTDPFAPPAAVVLARFRDVRWFVANNGRPSGRSLYVSRLGGDPEEVAEGVQQMQVTYLENGTNSYEIAPTNWGDVIAVRVELTLQGPDVDGQTIQRTASNVVSLRGRTL